MTKKCPVCPSTKITENNDGEKACQKCSYVWKPSHKIEENKNEN